MQVSVENTGGLERRLTIHVPESEIKDKVDSKLKELTKQVRIKGFRPGRVPMSVVKQRFGKKVRQDIVNETMQTSLRQAIQEESLRPASIPRVDSPPEGLDKGDLDFTAVIEVYPELATIDVSNLEINRPETEVSDEDVDEMLQTLREQRKEWNLVERTAQAGDQVVIEFVAETDEGRVPAQGKQRLTIIMGESGFDDLDSAIAEIPAGEEKKVELEFPQSYREPSLAGNQARVELQVVSVSAGSLPEVDEDFIKGFGVADGLHESMRQEIRGNLERELAQAIKSMMKTRLIDELVKTMPELEVPSSIVRDEARRMAAQALSSPATEPDEAVVKAFMEIAEGRVRGGLLMGELAQQNDIQIEPARVREAIEIIANTYEEPAEIMQMYYGNQQLLQQVEIAVLDEQVVDWVLKNAKVTSQKMTFQEVLSRAPKAPNESV
ncbi:MAG: trigger factor [Proteobacteria bacterium]|nr:trigger factor [Pseudomonadota bacterium]